MSTWGTGGVGRRGGEKDADVEVTDPDGDFVEAIGRQHSPEAAARIIKEHMSDWKGGVKRS